MNFVKVLRRSVFLGCWSAMKAMLKAPKQKGLEGQCSVAFVWGCSEKVPTATGKSWKNDRVEGAIGGKRSQNAGEWG
jgi:hypothetical protein